MQISKRLQAAADMVSPGGRLADIGTDHGYVPIFLVRENRIPSAVALDINQGPLERARLHIKQYKLEEQIETRLSDGLAKLLPGEADSILIAGMGGMLTVRILENGREVLCQAKELILQPQSDIRAVRLFLKENGYRINLENMVEEDGKFYPMMRAVRAEEKTGASDAEGDLKKGGWPGSEPQTHEKRTDPDRKGAAPQRTGDKKEDIPDLEELSLRYGPELLRQRHPVLLRYLEYEQAQLETIREKLLRSPTPAAVRRLEEVCEDLRLNGAAQAICG